MEDLVMGFWHGRRVLVTGHTGFKGTWLSLWLVNAGAKVIGVSLPPDTRPSMFDQLSIEDELDHRIADIRDSSAVAAIVAETSPDAVFHLAAQSLVLRGYREPLTTWHTNVMGTIHILEALRALDKPCAAVLVTTDKVYQNEEWEFGYRESDRLGGHDPYSASKAAAEVAISSWRHSYLNGISPVRIASVRAGNVIGGGDWSENRIVPDMVRALSAGIPIQIRNPRAVRPWQHVLEPLSGYLLLAQRLLESDERRYQTSFNFGPKTDSERTVRELVEETLRHWPGTAADVSNPDVPHEAGKLALSIDRARTQLGWTPRWDFASAVRETIDWYRASANAQSHELRELSLCAIRYYEKASSALTHS